MVAKSLFLVPLHLAALAFAAPQASSLIDPGQCLQAGGSCEAGSIRMEPFVCKCDFSIPAKRDNINSTAPASACPPGTIDCGQFGCKRSCPLRKRSTAEPMCPAGNVICGEFGCMSPEQCSHLGGPPVSTGNHQNGKRSECHDGTVDCGAYGCLSAEICSLLGPGIEITHQSSKRAACPSETTPCPFLPGDRCVTQAECLNAIPKPNTVQTIPAKRDNDLKCGKDAINCGTYCTSPTVGCTIPINTKRDNDLKCGKDAINCGTYCTSPTVGCTIPINTKRDNDLKCSKDAINCGTYCTSPTVGCTLPIGTRSVEKICPLNTISCPNYDGCFPEIEGCPEDETISINFKRGAEKICPLGYSTCPNYDGCFPEAMDCAA